MKAYCVKCRKSMEMKNEVKKKSKNGRNMVL